VAGAVASDTGSIPERKHPTPTTLRGTSCAGPSSLRRKSVSIPTPNQVTAILGHWHGGRIGPGREGARDPWPTNICDAATGRYVDLGEAGIIDPTKVVRIALENAVSVASVLLLTEATLTEFPEPKEAPAPASGME
jgi:hypothetical protein